VLDYLRAESGQHFDPKVVDLFFNSLDKMPV
jgi:response regulator RpfG family c-di-GMP phosphodiesterase